MSKPGHDKATAITAIDLLRYVVVVVLVIAAIAMARMSKPDAAQAVEMEAEPNIEMTWPDGNFNDLDFWLITLSD